MANNIVLKTYKGGNVTPQDDAIIHETTVPVNGIFKGCEVSHARGNVLRISQGFGMIKGRFFEVYESEIAVQLSGAGQTLNGRIYIHMDLANLDEPIVILSKTARELPDLDMDNDVNYNNSSYDIELASFTVTSAGIDNLTMTFDKIMPGVGGSGGGGGNTLQRDTPYEVGDTATVSAAPGWVTLVCTQAGSTALAEPSAYATITAIGDSILDGSCIFTARNIVSELDDALEALTEMDSSLNQLSERVDQAMNSSGTLVTKIMSLADYKALESYQENCIYFCYTDENTQKITNIYFGQNIIFFEGVTVTYQIDTGESETMHLDGGADAILEAPAVEKEGYEFLGWRSDTEANNRVLTSYRISQESDTTLYAVFSKPIDIFMNAGSGSLKEGGKETNLSSVAYYNNGNKSGEEVEIPECPYEKENMSFIGWECNGEFYKPRTKGVFMDDGAIIPSWIDTEYDFPFTNNHIPFTIPADGIYEFEVWGASGSDLVQGNVTANGGLGGHAKGYKKMNKGQVIYIYNGGAPSSTNYSGINGGAGGYTYSSSSSTKHYGSGGGGATSIMNRSGVISTSGNSTTQQNYYKAREQDILIIAGGGGGAAILNVSTPNKGGDGGGERGEDGSGGNLGGRQISTGANDYTNFGVAPNYSGNGTTYSGGGGGYFGGLYGLNGHSGAGGSGYVGGVPGFVYNKKFYGNLNEVGVNKGNGYSYIRYVEVV